MRSNGSCAGGGKQVRYCQKMLAAVLQLGKEFVLGNASLLGWWVLIGLIVVVAVIAIIFAALAFGESGVNQPNRNIVRNDIIAKGDLAVNGDTRVYQLD